MPTAAPLILVVGMHRSGTSLLASVLQALGAELPGQLISGDDHNPEGYFEWDALVALQERLLIDLERWWPSAEGTQPMPEGWLEHPATRTTMEVMLGLLKTTAMSIQASCWAVKDPRSSRLLPLWLRLTSELNIPLRLLLAIRDPDEVVRSLVKRDGPVTGMNIKRAQNLWWRFNLEPLWAADNKYPLTIIDYGDWFGRPDHQIQVLLAAIPELSPTSEQCQMALNQIRPDYRRSVSDGTEQLPLHRSLRKLHLTLLGQGRRSLPPSDPPRSLREDGAKAWPPESLANQPKTWPLWLHQWHNHPAPRSPNQISLAPRARIRVNGASVAAAATHLFLQRLPISNIVGIRVLKTAPDGNELWLEIQRQTFNGFGLERITINLEPPPAENSLDWLERLRDEQAIWDPDPPRVLLMRAIGLPAYWLDPAGEANGWLAQPAASEPHSWAITLGLAPPTKDAVIVLGHAGGEWDRALAQESAASSSKQKKAGLSKKPLPIDYRPGWFNLITSGWEAALAQAGWLVRAARDASALVWIQAEQEATQRLLPDANARLLLLGAPLTPSQLRGRLDSNIQPALAEDRPSPASQALFEWALPHSARAAVVVSLYNYSNRIADALNSVAEQTEQQLELIVVDDASEDGGAEVVQAWMQEQQTRHQHPFVRMTLIRHSQNAGLATTRNTGFHQAKAPWCFVLDADNRLYPDAVAACVTLAEQGHESLAVVHPLLAVQAEPGMEAEGRSLVATASWQREMLVNANAVDAMALVRRSAWLSVGGYTHIEGGWEDYDFWCKLMAAGFHGVQCPKLLAVYQSHQNSMSNTVTNYEWSSLKKALQIRHPWLNLMQQP
ncbi:MAG: glycosyltransferase [Synechococcus sp. ELA057]